MDTKIPKTEQPKLVRAAQLAQGGQPVNQFIDEALDHAEKNTLPVVDFDTLEAAN